MLILMPLLCVTGTATGTAPELRDRKERARPILAATAKERVEVQRTRAGPSLPGGVRARPAVSRVERRIPRGVSPDAPRKCGVQAALRRRRLSHMPTPPNASSESVAGSGIV